MRQTLSRAQRLTRSRLFGETMDRGTVYRARNFVLFCHVTGSLGPPQVGFFASRRLGGAVERNRAKRRLREAYRRTRERIEVGGVRLVFQARREAAGSPFQDLIDEMERVFRKAGLSPGGTDRPVTGV